MERVVSQRHILDRSLPPTVVMVVGVVVVVVEDGSFGTECIENLADEMVRENCIYVGNGDDDDRDQDGG